MSPAGLVLLAFVWSAVVWAGASLICRLRPAPKMAQAIWRGAALVLLAPFAASLILPALPMAEIAPLPDLPLPEAGMAAPAAGNVAAAGQAFRLPDVGTLIIGLVAAGWLVRFSLWAVSQVRLQRLKADSIKADRPIGHWMDALGLKRTPEVRVILRGTPFLAGVFRRSVYVPAALIDGPEAQQVIVHELVHLKRGDLFTRPLERMVADLFWFSPFAWALRERLDYWREAVVDEAAAELTGDRIAYARALTRAARLSRPVTTLPVAALILKQEGSLKMRVTELLTDRARPRRMGLVLAAALTCAAPLALAQGMLIKGAAAGPAESLSYSHAVLDEAKLTSAYGLRKHPLTGEMKLHAGVDLAAPEGEPVHAPAAGVVTFAEAKKGYGNLIEITAGTTRFRFAQLQDIDVAVGDTVSAGDVIGTVGQTGPATGPHLHFEVWHGSESADPQAEEGLVLAGSLQ